MQRARKLVQAISVAAVLATAAPAFGTTEGYRISGPAVHANLAVYFVHGQGSTGPVPLALQEALARRAVRVHETGQVSELSIENLGDQEVFVQSGDIVKGGQQDRVLTVSLVIPPRSGRIPIASFCVEQGRWSARGKEDVKTFATAAASVPSREAKLAIRAPGSAAFGCASFGIAAFANPSMGVLAPRPREHCIGRRRGALGHSPRE